MIWSKGFGYADIENQIPVDPSLTKFRIGSVSKTLTAAAMGDLMKKTGLIQTPLFKPMYRIFQKRNMKLLFVRLPDIPPVFAIIEASSL